MFTERTLSSDLADLLEDVSPQTQVLDCEQEFETMPADWVYELALITDDIHSLGYPDSWVPDDAPNAAQRTTGANPVIGMPDDGSVAWTRQTDPPFVFVKPRASGLPDEFRDFLIAEAIVEVSRDIPETPVGYFAETYRTVHETVESPMVAFQLAAALRRGWIGLHTRETFAEWDEPKPRLHAAWADAGDRLVDRVEEIPTLMAEGQLGFADGTELACNAIKHDISLPSPWAAVDVDTFAEHGAPFAVRWIEESIPDTIAE